MKHKKFPSGQSQNPASASRSAPGANFNQNEIDSASSPDEAARKSYFSSANQGSRHGHEVQHWLEAEAQMLTERKLTRTHGFHNPT
jgi:hypothetical protein